MNTHKVIKVGEPEDALDIGTIGYCREQCSLWSLNNSESYIVAPLTEEEKKLYNED